MLHVVQYSTQNKISMSMSMRSAGSLFQRTMDMGGNGYFSNRQMCESVCKKEGACDECILQDAQNMTEVVSGVITYDIAWLLQTRSMAPTLIYMFSFPFV